MAGFLSSLASSLTKKNDDTGSGNKGKGKFELPGAAMDQLDKMAGKLGISANVVHQGLDILGVKTKPERPQADAERPEVAQPTEAQAGGGAWEAVPPNHHQRPTAEGEAPIQGSYAQAAHRPAGAPQNLPQEVTQASYPGLDVSVRPEELQELGKAAARIWELDVNRLIPGQDYTVNASEGKTSYSTQDMAGEPLFTSVNPNIFRRPTFGSFRALLDNYVADVTVAEKVTAEEIKEMNVFIDNIMLQPCMQYTHKLLAAKQLAPPDEISFKKLLWKIWFELYNRGGGRGSSSGFEHVFVGEVRDGQVMGFHNWIQFYLMEKEGKVDYRGYIFPRRRGGPKPDGETQLLTIQFSWHGELKAVGSTFVGVSPEFEMALYTLCFLAGGEDNHVVVGGYPVNIKCHRQGAHIGTAYPECDS